MRSVEKIFWAKLWRNFILLWGFVYLLMITFWTVRYFFGFGFVRFSVVLVSTLIFSPLIFSYSFSFSIWQALKEIPENHVEIFGKSKKKVFLRHVILASVFVASANLWFGVYLSPKAYKWIVQNIYLLVPAKKYDDIWVVAFEDKILFAREISFENALVVKDGVLLDSKKEISFSKLVLAPKTKVGAFFTDKELYELAETPKLLQYIITSLVSPLFCINSFFTNFGFFCVPALNLAQKLTFSFFKENFLEISALILTLTLILPSTLEKIFKAKFP